MNERPEPTDLDILIRCFVAALGICLFGLLLVWALTSLLIEYVFRTFTF